LSEFLTRIHREVTARLIESRAAVEESRRLEAALEALDNGQSAVRPSAPSVSRGTRRASGERRPARRKRARRGANREAVLRVVGERPGITPSELVAASGVEKRSLYTLLSTLTKDGVLERTELPGGQNGYRLARAASPSSAIG